jgi:hypothetical protein
MGWYDTGWYYSSASTMLWRNFRGTWFVETWD